MINSLKSRRPTRYSKILTLNYVMMLILGMCNTPLTKIILAKIKKMRNNEHMNNNKLKREKLSTSVFVKKYTEKLTLNAILRPKKFKEPKKKKNGLNSKDNISERSKGELLNRCGSKSEKMSKGKLRHSINNIKDSIKQISTRKSRPSERSCNKSSTITSCMRKARRSLMTCTCKTMPTDSDRMKSSRLSNRNNFKKELT
jgi:hypothetical protein